MSERIEITTNLDEMIRDMDRLASIAPAQVSRELDGIVRSAFEETQVLVPVDQGDSRRPAGALKASGRVATGQDYDDQWSASIEYGDEDDSGVPYARWAEVKGDSDWMTPTRAAEQEITRVIEEGLEP